MSTKRINWKKVIDKALILANRYTQQYSTPPTLRGLFYMLVSENTLPNTKSAYKRLSSVLATARYSGDFPWNLVKDETRSVFYLEPEEHYSTEELSEEKIRELLKELIDSHFDVSVNPWQDQKWRVIIILEKQALADTVRNAVKQAFPHGIYQVRVIRGYDSATDVKKLAEDIAYLLVTHNVAVLLLTDFDPSGEDIARDFEKRVKMVIEREYKSFMEGSKLIFEKIAILPEQIIKLSIPPAPESVDELVKLRRDPRYSGFLERIKKDPTLKELVEHHGIVRAELDALIALRHDEFINILKSAIEKYWDQSIYKTKTLARVEELKRKSEEARNRSLENLRKLLGDGQ